MGEPHFDEIDSGMTVEKPPIFKEEDFGELKLFFVVVSEYVGGGVEHVYELIVVAQDEEQAKELARRHAEKGLKLKPGTYTVAVLKSIDKDDLLPFEVFEVTMFTIK